MHTFPKIIHEEIEQPKWLIGQLCDLRDPIAYIDAFKLAKKNYYCNQTVDGELSIWKIKSHPVTIKRQEIPINFETLLWVGITVAEGTKGKSEFINVNPDIIKIFLNGLNEIFDLNTIDVHYDILIGEIYHEMVHHFLNEPMEKNIQTQTVPRCTNSRVISFIQKIVFGEIPLKKEILELKKAIWGIPPGIDHTRFQIPELKRCRFYRLRVDRTGKKSNLRIEINFKGTAADFLWEFVRGIFSDIDRFVSTYGRLA